MEMCRPPLLLLLVTAVIALNIVEGSANTLEEDEQVKNLTNNLLQGISLRNDSSSITKLVIDEGVITLNDAERLALATYPNLEELHLDGNKVTSIPAKYFTVVPHLVVLSLSRNNISSLDPESFSGLDALTVLDLSNNQLTSLPPQLFRGLNRLQVVNLAGNPWNCSCPLLSTIKYVQTKGVSTGYTEGPRATCASPEKQAGTGLLDATAACFPPAVTSFTTKKPKPPTRGSIRKLWTSSIKLRTTTKQKNNTNEEPAAPSGNSWRFAACVAALALCTSVVIVCGIKGPSWYKLFYNYRHQRLHSTEEEEEEEGNVVSTVFSKTGRYLNREMLSYEREKKQEIEEDEDGYFEDPYIKREE